MIASLPQSRQFRLVYGSYVSLFFLYLSAPLIVVAVFAFNDSLFPSLPWNGFTSDWFVGDSAPKLGLFYETPILKSIGISLFVALMVTVASIAVGTCNAFLFEREQFPFKSFFYMLMLLPLVIPGIILGISILVFSNTIANGVEDVLDYDLEMLRPGLFLVVLGQFSFITTIATLVISARLRKFDISLEEAAHNLGATRWRVLRTITLPWLRPAMIGAGLVAFLMSFENFNTTLMLVGSDSPLTVTMYDRLREGSTPVLNAVSLFLMLVSGLLALISIMVQRDKS